MTPTEIKQLQDELATIKGSKFFRLWQKYCSLRNRLFKNSSRRPSSSTYDYYHKNTFWNDHPLVCEYLNELATDNKSVDWMHFLYQHYFRRQTNQKMLSVVCGNGWQDRELDKIFNFRQIVGYDISPSLIKEAKTHAPSRKFHYYLADLNRDSLHQKNFDLAINLAGLHHIANMDHAVSQVYQSLKTNGIFANFDYIGPQRNQYSDDDLRYMNQMQHNFPEKLVGRQLILRPSLEIMLQEDPSEAVGSENIIPTLKKYFQIKYLRYLNGGMLYQVLYNHIQNFDPRRQSHQRLLLKNLALEKKLTAQGKIKPFFAFVVCVKK